MFQRRGGVYYWQDNQTQKQGSLGTKDEHTAAKLLHAKNESHEQPILNLALARVYASAHDPKMASRTWREVMAEMASHGKASTQERCTRAMNSKAFEAIRDKGLIATTSDDLLCIMLSARYRDYEIPCLPNRGMKLEAPAHVGTQSRKRRRHTQSNAAALNNGTA